MEGSFFQAVSSFWGPSKGPEAPQQSGPLQRDADQLRLVSEAKKQTQTVNSNAVPRAALEALQASAAAEKAKLEAQLCLQHEELSRKDQEHANMSRKVEGLESHIRSIITMKERLEKFGKVRLQVQRKSFAERELESQVQQLQAANQQLQAQVEAAAQLHEAGKAEWEAERAQWDEAVKAGDQFIRELRATQQQELEAARAEKAEALAERDSSRDGWRVAYAASEAAEAKLASLQAQAAELEARASKSEELQLQAQQQIAALKADVVQAQGSVAEARTLQQQLWRAEGEVKKSATAQKQAEAVIEEMKREVALLKDQMLHRSGTISVYRQVLAAHGVAGQKLRDEVNRIEELEREAERQIKAARVIVKLVDADDDQAPSFATQSRSRASSSSSSSSVHMAATTTTMIDLTASAHSCQGPSSGSAYCQKQQQQQQAEVEGMASAIPAASCAQQQQQQQQSQPIPARKSLKRSSSSSAGGAPGSVLVAAAGEGRDVWESSSSSGSDDEL